MSVVPGQDTVAELSSADVPAAARLHAKELPDGFLSRLGPGFLCRYLSTFRDTPGGVALVAHDEHGSFVGFVVGSTRARHNRTALRLHGRRLLPAAAAALLRRPWLLLPFLRTRALRYLATALSLVGRRTTSPSPVAAGTSRTAVLLHVAVDPDHRGRGAGALLVRAFVDAARAADCTRVLLVAFGENEFYSRLGWHRVSSRQDSTSRLVVTYGLDL